MKNRPTQKCNSKAILGPVQYQLILLAYFLYIVFEWTFWGVMPLSYQAIAVLRAVFDAFLFFFLLINGLINNTSINLMGRRMLAAMGVVLLSVMISTLLYQTSPFLAIQSVFVVFRYLIILTIPQFKLNIMFKRFILYVFFVQIAIGLIEASQLINLRFILLPSAYKWSGINNFNPTAIREGQVGISSTFLNTIDYSFYLIISYIALYWRKVRDWKWAVAPVVLFLIFRTESKTSMFAFSMLLLFEIHSHLLRRAIMLILAVPGIALVFANADLVIFFLENSLEYSRIGFFVYLLPSFFSAGPLSLLFGVGVDPYVGLKTIEHYPHIPQMLLDENSLLNLKDVFWIAQLFQWGLLGFSALISFLLSIHKKIPSITVKAILLVVFLLGFSNQVLEVKIFSFLLWIIVRYHDSFDEVLRMR